VLTRSAVGPDTEFLALSPPRPSKATSQPARRWSDWASSAALGRRGWKCKGLPCRRTPTN